MPFKQTNFPKFSFKSRSGTHYRVTWHHRNKAETSLKFLQVKGTKDFQPECKGVFRGQESGEPRGHQSTARPPRPSARGPSAVPGGTCGGRCRGPALGPALGPAQQQHVAVHGRPGRGGRRSEGPALPPGTALRTAALPLPAAPAGSPCAPRAAWRVTAGRPR